MGKEVDDQLARRRTGGDNAPTALQRFLGVAAVDIFLHPIKNLLHIHPDIAGPQVFRLAAFPVLGDLAAYGFVVAAQEAGDVGIFGGGVKGRFSFGVVKQFLPHRHPVPLRPVAPLIPHSDKAAALERRFPQHQHKLRKGLKAVVLVSPQPDIQAAVFRHCLAGSFNPAAAPGDIALHRLGGKGRQIIGRILDG